MAPSLPHRRLVRHGLAARRWERPADVVAAFGAMQGQELDQVRWAIGIRSGATRDAVDRALDDGEIVRGWLMRGTLHLVAAADLRWMVALLGPKIIHRSARRYRELGLDTDVLARAMEVLRALLAGHPGRTRATLLAGLDQAGIDPGGQRGYYLLRHAALEGEVCLGPVEGNEQRFVLVNEWVSSTPPRERDEALAALATRYIAAHGPATVEDFIWWSGLRAAEARAALAGAGDRLRRERIDGREYWDTASPPPDPGAGPRVHLLPAYDEYYLGYRARESLLDARYAREVVSSNGVFRPIIVLDGRIVGIWRRAGQGNDNTVISPYLFESPDVFDSEELRAAATAYGSFVGRGLGLAPAAVIAP